MTIGGRNCSNILRNCWAWRWRGEAFARPPNDMGFPSACSELFLIRLILRRQKPVFGDKFVLPTKKNLDVALVAGSALFGVGWGLVGYCPGPVVASLPAGALPTATFAGAMVVGFILYNRFEPAAARPNASRPPAPSQAAAKESLS